MHPLEFRVLDLPEVSRHATATLVLGQHRAVLLGAGLRLADGRRLVREVSRSGRRLGAVLVPHHAPEYWLAAEVLREAFPDAAVLAPDAVRARIERDYPAVRAAWAPLGAELPSRLVALEPLPGDAVELEDHRLEWRGASLALPDLHYLWEHRSRTLLGGQLLWQDVHPWLAEVPHAAQREAWIDLLDEMAALEPSRTVAGHRLLSPAAPAPDPLGWTADYLRGFATELGKPVGPEAVTAAVLRRHPSAALPSAVAPAVRAARAEPAAA
ncbi:MULTISPECIES: MBL fold metallo-hydrolase [Kitasatospora]|uniref:Metallo-beta-lactamase domain-containing protein n=1 Tax=Kitasatospora setae (strain ATCC 33774 / DSM 43861 / JCM 3304 / KCC A-0304 / NBRC 14216 / KM-6054) TaxID=452652 RepID=E4N3Q7_KITSK|nr:MULTISPECIES: MBL fold metallo-hydrolase [Kitasatospora]BAJ31538.1 hypothetical protein KSE_57650 [Kitasatospora setae KM-6054]